MNKIEDFAIQLIRAEEDVQATNLAHLKAKQHHENLMYRFRQAVKTEIDARLKSQEES